MRDDLEVRLRPQAMKALAVLSAGSIAGNTWRRVDARGGLGGQRRVALDVTVGEVRRTLRDTPRGLDSGRRSATASTCLDSDYYIRSRAAVLEPADARAVSTTRRVLHARAAAERDFRAFEGQSVCYLMLLWACARPARLPAESCRPTLAPKRSSVSLPSCATERMAGMFERRLPARPISAGAGRRPDARPRLRPPDDVVTRGSGG